VRCVDKLALGVNASCAEPVELAATEAGGPVVADAAPDIMPV
jgi:hypothetical protein